ncbi:hypothetical protein MD484_g6085, partial [Candolleomyces efflorescens]
MLLSFVWQTAAIPFAGVENEVIVPRQEDGPQYRVCYPLTADQVQSLPGWKKLEAQAIERWGEGFEVNYPDRGAEVCIGDVKVSTSFAEEPVCTRSGTEAISSAVGTNGDISYTEEIGSVRTMEWSVTGQCPSSPIGVGELQLALETTSLAASVGFSATFGVLGIGEAGIETTFSAGVTNAIGSSDKVENSNKKSIGFKFSNPDGKSCKMIVDVEDCQAMAKARVPIVATGHVWFWYQSRRFDSHKSTDTSHFHWNLLMENHLTEEERSSFIGVTGTVKSQSTVKFDTNCTSVNPAPAPNFPAPSFPPIILPSISSVGSSEAATSTSISPTATVTTSQNSTATTSPTGSVISSQDPPVSTSSRATTDLSGQTVIVVGANTGLGFEAAKHFARMNPGRLILACRSKEKGAAAAYKIREETRCQSVELQLLDLSKFSSVIAFVDNFLKDGSRLDVLVANAAVFTRTYKTTDDGWEESEVHYWTSLDDAKVINATSSFQAMSAKDFCTPEYAPSTFLHNSIIDQSCQYDRKMKTRYDDTKLLNVFFTRSLASLLKGTPVIVNCVNPGFCFSELAREATGAIAFLVWFIQTLLARSSEQGSRQLVYAAVGSSENPDQLHGGYINLDKVDEPSDFVVGDAGRKRQDKLWADLVRELSKIDGRIPSIVRELSSQTK